MNFPYPLKYTLPPELMSKMRDKVILIYRAESTWTMFPKDEITLYQRVNGEFYLKGRPIRHGVMCVDTDAIPIKEIRVSKRWVTGLFFRLENAKISAFPPPQMGADGGFTELEIGGYAGKAHYRWWSEPPESWKVLDQIASEIYDKFYNRSLLSKLTSK